MCFSVCAGTWESSDIWWENERTANSTHTCIYMYGAWDINHWRNLSTIWQSSMLYPKYCEPVEAGESEYILSLLTFLTVTFDLWPLYFIVGKHETRKLWRHIEPYFRGVMSKIYLREISTWVGCGHSWWNLTLTINVCSVQWQKAQGENQAAGPSTAASLAQGTYM